MGEEREHIDTRGLDCWCEPTIAYENEVYKIIVHHEWVNGEVQDA